MAWTRVDSLPIAARHASRHIGAVGAVSLNPVSPHGNSTPRGSACPRADQELARQTVCQKRCGVQGNAAYSVGAKATMGYKGIVTGYLPINTVKVLTVLAPGSRERLFR